MKRKKHCIRTIRITFIFLAIFSISFGVALSEEIYRFERMWPALQQPWYFKQPTDVDIDNKGFIYIADTENRRIQKFTTDGYFMAKWGKLGTNDREFQCPEAIAVKNGFVYVADSGTHRIQKFTTNGQFICSWGGYGDEPGKFNMPVGIAVDNNGDVYVADELNCRIQKFDPDGNYKTGWGGLGDGNGMFKAPTDVATAPDGSLYVADNENHRIQKFNANGEFIRSWGEFGNEDGKFIYPAGITVDEEGVVYVTDTAHPWSAAGQSESLFGSDLSDLDPELLELLGWGWYTDLSDIEWDPELLELWGVDSVEDLFPDVETLANQRIQKFSADGVFLDKWGIAGKGDGEFDFPTGIAVDNNGNVYVADSGNDCVQKFTGKLHQFAVKFGMGGIEPGKFSIPQGVAVDSNKYVYVADNQNNRIQKFDAEGKFEYTWGTHGSGDGEFSGLSGITASNDGFVYVIDYWNNRIQKFDSDGVFKTKWGSSGTGNGQFAFPFGIAADNNGHIYVADTGNNCIQKFKSDGAHLATWGGYGEEISTFKGPMGVAVNSKGYVYVTDSGNHRILKLTSDGVVLYSWGIEGTGKSEFNTPAGITIDKSDHVYVADKWNGRVQKFDADGNFVAIIGEFGSGPGLFMNPEYLCVNSDGTLYVTDSIYRVQALRIKAAGNSKAIIVAGNNGDTSDDDIWGPTQIFANYAFRTLTYQGFTKNTICYLSHDDDLDLDDNGETDEVDGEPTIANFEKAVKEWAADTENVVIYMVDHGKNGKFVMSESEDLEAADLDKWLDQLQNTIPGKAIVIYDACYSGSFLPLLKPDSADMERIVVTSASGEEYITFPPDGSISFSIYFWPHIFNGHNIKDAFDKSGHLLGYSDSQSPQLDDNGDGNYTPQDGALAQKTLIGNGTLSSGVAPEIKNIPSPRTLTGIYISDIYADVTDEDGVDQVWAVIRPPDYYQGSSEDISAQEPIVVELKHVPNSDRYEGTYDKFNTPGTYTICIYAKDNVGNTSIPELTTVEVKNPLTRKAIILAGGPKDSELWPAVEKSVTAAFEALTFQGYTNDDIYLLSPDVIPGVTKEPVFPTSAHLQDAVEKWAKQNTQDLVIYMVGNGDAEYFHMDDTELLSAADFSSWIGVLQKEMPGTVTVICDTSYSKSFLQPLLNTDSKQILIMSTESDQPAHFVMDGSISFSSFFWKNILNGKDVWNAFSDAKRGITDLVEQTPILDADGNGVGSEGSDKILAENHKIGTGIIKAGEEPAIGAVSPEQTISGSSAAIWVENVSPENFIDKVLAFVIFTSKDAGQSAGPITELPVFELTPDNSGRYSGTYDGFSDFGTYRIVVYASDKDGNMSQPVKTEVYRPYAPDIYEVDNTWEQAGIVIISKESQHHNFHVAGDADWIKFYGIFDQKYTISARNLESDCDIAIDLYDTDGETVLRSVDYEPGNSDEYFNWTCPEKGVYYVKYSHKKEDVFGENTGYDLQVTVYAAPGTGTIQGYVIDKNTGAPLGGVYIETDQFWSAISNSSGFYRMSRHPEGDFDIAAEKTGYQAFDYSDYLESDEILNVDIEMIHGNYSPQSVSLADAISVLKIMTGIETKPTMEDINKNGRIGLEEAIYVLEKLSNLR